MNAMAAVSSGDTCGLRPDALRPELATPTAFDQRPAVSTVVGNIVILSGNPRHEMRSLIRITSIVRLISDLKTHIVCDLDELSFQMSQILEPQHLNAIRDAKPICAIKFIYFF